jgi:hypothetical protein
MRDLPYPQLLLVALAVALALALGVAGATSTDNFGIYNPGWDGVTEIRSVADSAGLETTVVRNTTAYGTTDENGTVTVVLAPDERYGPAQAGRVRQFVRAGGTLLVAEDYGPHANALLGAVGANATVAGTPLRDERTYGAGPAFPRATNVSTHPYTRGVDALVLNHGTAVRPGGSRVLVASSEFAHLDADGDGQLDDAETLDRYPVVTVERLGAGRVVVVSDPSVFINTMLDRGDNRVFLGNVVADHDRVLLDVSHARGLPPLAAVRLTLQSSGLWQVAVGGAAVLLFGFASRWTGRASALRDRLGPDDSPPDLSREKLLAAVRQRHPEWDADRVERVIDRLLDRGS